MVDYPGHCGQWVRVRLHCRCMEAPRMCEERSWHREEVEVIDAATVAELIEQHEKECETRKEGDK